MKTASASSYKTGFVTSADGTRIGYRQLGKGPGVIALHGGMQAAQHLMRLAESLSEEFTVYLPDRRGRGLSGPHGNGFSPGYGIKSECEDVAALLEASGARNIFGLSSGAIVALRSALTMPSIQKMALYEPPFSIDHSSPTKWLAPFDKAIAHGKLASALAAALKGTHVSPMLGAVPDFALVPFLKVAIKMESFNIEHGDVPIKVLIPTMHFDGQLVRETEGTLEEYRAVSAGTLLMGGSKSPRFLKVALDGLNNVLPKVRRIEFPGVGHLAPENTGQPNRIAKELRIFFAKAGHDK
jgi:pimeloyl-ACP methyl ester carboxylesterase